ncbi:unnamed protein product [Ceutorhynchus assimilis]|uniref:Macro domain-containing protein n=1 Tax=Ceutorhynchus assimilis TaxID=467358 RepID=A0A9N9MMR8_9CUCU|nr:unnamed protein product [Ceutorhynchus assimilis]
MEGGWINATGLRTAPALKPFNLNPNANVFVPKNVENNGSSAETPLPPAPFRPEIRQSMQNSSEMTNVIPPAFYPTQITDSHAQYIPANPIYGQGFIPNCVVVCANNYVPFPQNQFIQIENLKLQETQQMSLDDQSNTNQLSVTSLDESNYNDDSRKPRLEEGNKRLVSDRDSRQSEESDQERSFSASNDELNNHTLDINVSQSCCGPMRSGESSRDNNELSWSEQHANCTSVGHIDPRQPDFHRNDRGKRFFRETNTYSNRGHKNWGYQEKLGDHANEESFNKNSDRQIQHHETYKGRSEGGYRGRYFKGYNNSSNNFSYRGRGYKHSRYQEKSADLSNEEYLNESSDRFIEKIQGYNEDDSRRARENRPFRGSDNFSSGNRRNDFNKNYNSHEVGRMNKHSSNANDKTSDDRDSKNLTQKNSVEKPFDQGHDKNDLRSPKEYDQRRDKETWHNKKRDFKHEEPSDNNREHGDSNNIVEETKYKHSSGRSNKNSEESTITAEKLVKPSNQEPFGQIRDEMRPNLHNRGTEKGNWKMERNRHSYNKDFEHQELKKTNPEHRDSSGKYRSSSKNSEETNFTGEKLVRPSNQEQCGQIRDENDQMGPNLHNRGTERGNWKMEGNRRSYNKDFGHQELKKTNPEHRDSSGKYRSNNNAGEKELEISKSNYDRNNAFSENTQESIGSKKETKIQQATYSEKNQNQKSYENPKEENDWSDKNKKSNFDKRSRHNQEFSEDFKKKTYDKRKRNVDLEEESPENKFNNLNIQPRKSESRRENKNWNIKNDNTSNKGRDNYNFEARDDKNLENNIETPVEETCQSSYEHDVGDTNVHDSLVELDSEAIQHPKAHAKKEGLSKEKDKRNAHKSSSKYHQSYSDTRNSDNFSLMESLLAKENEMKMQNRVIQENSPPVKHDDKRNKKDTRRKTDDIETKKFLDPRMERKKENIVDCSKLMRVTGPRESSTPVVTSYLDDSVEKEKRDKEYDMWDNHWEEIDDFKIVCEIQGNLFEQPKDFSLAHCVAEDLRMGSGIAVDFKREFKNLPNLLDQRAKQGGLATIHDQANDRFVYYLVTKKDSTGKPTYYTLWKSLFKMRDHIKENKVTKLAIPRLGCGLDRLEWDKVKAMLEYLFTDMKIEIRVCNFQQFEHADYKSKCKLVIEEVPVTKIAPSTLILYLATTKGEEDDIIRNMSKKFNFWPSFKKQEKTLGDIVYFDDKVQNYGICACVVRKTRREPISFLTLHSCLQKINKKNKEFGNNCFEYVALQWLDSYDYFDDSINQKIITMLINFLRNVDVYICRGDFEEP